jgi:hypothetical protein
MYRTHLRGLEYIVTYRCLSKEDLAQGEDALELECAEGIPYDGSSIP